MNEIEAVQENKIFYIMHRYTIISDNTAENFAINKCLS